MKTSLYELWALYHLLIEHPLKDPIDQVIALQDAEKTLPAEQINPGIGPTIRLLKSLYAEAIDEARRTRSPAAGTSISEGGTAGEQQEEKTSSSPPRKRTRQTKAKAKAQKPAARP